jgi:gamma-glutamyltranspeptidase / glutathione hydrolase
MTTIYPLVMGGHAMVTTEHYLSAAAGARIFAKGGNAIDAAVAATFVEGIVNPHLHTIGGEAPILVRPAGGERVFAINGNMTAPARATIEHFRGLGIKLIPGQGLLAAGVPAALDALLTALENFGTFRLAQVLEPALELAEDGFPAHPGLVGNPDLATTLTGTTEMAALHFNARNFLKRWPTSAQLYLPGGRVPKVGDPIKNPALAGFFRRLMDAEAGIRNSGRAAGLAAARARFFRGDIAADIVKWSDSNGGLLSAEDLARFKTRIEEPVAISYHGFRVFKCGPWSQGPVFLQQLRLLEGFDLAALGHNSASYIHCVIEAAKLAFADREAWYGDPEYTQVPMEGLLSSEYAAMRRRLIDPRRALLDAALPGDPIAMRPTMEPPAEARSWGRGTVHVDAADFRGNLIAITPSGGWIPSSPVIDTLGFPLGTRMQSFHLDEHHPNALAPGKRPRTTLTPSLAIDPAQRGIAFGTPGGDNQDQWTLQFFLNLVHFGMNLQEAIEAPRFSSGHMPITFYPHTANPGLLRIEERVEQAVRDDLAARGHVLDVMPPYREGFVLAVSYDPATGSLSAGADPRGQLSNLMPAQAIGW